MSRRVFAGPAEDPVEPLDTVEYDAQRFGTYDALIHREDWRFKDSFAGVGGRSQSRKGAGPPA